jgi:uncharacterized protein
VEHLKKKRGFALMSKERVVELAKIGGGLVPAEKRAFSRNPELARLAGSKGGRTPRKNRKRSS